MMMQMVDKPNTTPIDLQNFALLNVGVHVQRSVDCLHGVYPIVQLGSAWLLAAAN